MASARRRWISSHARRLYSVGSTCLLGQQREAAVDDQRVTAHHLGSGRAEPGNRLCDVGGLDEAAGRSPLQTYTHHLVLVGKVVERLGLDDPRRDGVDADPAWRELDGEVSHQRLE